MNGTRDKRLDDFAAVLEWFKDNGHEVVVIGGMAVGKYAPTVGESVLSGDLDVLATTQQQQAIMHEAPKVPGVRIEKRPQPRNLAALVLSWNGLEVDVLTGSTGLPPADEARARAWSFDGTLVVDPIDLLANKLAVNRPKDQAHIPIVRAACEGAALRAFETRPDRHSIEFVRRWAAVEKWEQLPESFFLELLSLARHTTAAGRRYLASQCPSRDLGDQLLGVAPAQEQPTLGSILKHHFG